MALIKEVQAVIDLGYSEEVATLIYEVLTNNFEFVCGRPDTEEFQNNLLDMRKNDRSYFRYLIDSVCSRYLVTNKLSWREVKYEPTRIERCEVCGNYFYDISRNGRSKTCERGGPYKVFDATNREYRYYHKNGKKLSVCAAEYEKRIRTGSVLYPTARRRRTEILTDFNPAENDKAGWAWLNDVQMAAWNRRF
jgi:hypothetical protein